MPRYYRFSQVAFPPKPDAKRSEDIFKVVVLKVDSDARGKEKNDVLEFWIYDRSVFDALQGVPLFSELEVRFGVSTYRGENKAVIEAVRPKASSKVAA